MAKYYSKDEALELLKKYCVYQDRCHSEVRTRLLKLNIYGDDLEDIIADLIVDKYLDEERFAKAYVRGKYRQKSWGRNKIKQGLQVKKVSEYCIKSGMKEIDEIEYMEILERLLSKRMRLKPKVGRLASFKDLVNHGQSRGYTYAECKEVANDVLADME